MLKDIKSLTELYLHSQGLLAESKSWGDFHDELTNDASKESIGILADANPKDKCKYAMFVNVDTKKKICEVKDYVEIGALENWASHLFWQGSGQRRSKGSRNSPHDYFSGRGEFSTNNLIEVLQTILNDYCNIKEGKRKKKMGPLFWDINKQKEREWLKNVIDILENEKENIDRQIKGEKQQGKFPSIKSGESVFVGLTVDNKPIGDYELFRRYLLFVRIRAGIEGGLKIFKHQIASEILRKFIGKCSSCMENKTLLNLWHVPAELSFYQLEKKSFSSFKHSLEASFKLCQSCANLLFIFKQHLLKTMSHSLGGNECLVLPSIKLIPSIQDEKRRLYENLKKIWDSSIRNKTIAEERLLYRLGQLPSYATVSFVFGDAITIGESQDVKRLDRLDVVFPVVLPSRLSQIANAIIATNKVLNEMWSLTGRTQRNWQCTWNIQDNFYLLYQLFCPSWEENKKDKSRRRSEVEQYLRAMFYGHEITHTDIANDCYSNLIFAIKTTRNAQKDDIKAQYARDNYIGNILSLLVFLKQLKETSKLEKEGRSMPETGKIGFSFIAMPDLDKFVEIHPLLKDSQYLAPFFVGCLFSYAENLQKGNSRLSAYNWLGTMSLTYEDILQDIYPKVLNYITNKEKIVSSPRLQELMKAISYYDKGKCDSNRVALVSFCHGWAVGRDFIYKKKEESKTINQEGGTSNG